MARTSSIAPTEFAVKFFREHGRRGTAPRRCWLPESGRTICAQWVAYKRLVKDNIVTFAGNCARRMGHGAAGGRLYEVVR